MSLFEERVEAAARSLYENMKRTTPGGKNYPSWDSESRFADVWRGDARSALRAADAVVTEEAHDEGMDAVDWEMVRDGVGDPQEAASIAVRAALEAAALFRGGAK